MSQEKHDLGREYYKKVYADTLPEMPEKGEFAFLDYMLETLFGTLWADEESLSIRDRRLVILGVIMSVGSNDLFSIQARAALMNKELSLKELEQIIITGTQYCGYPKVAAFNLILKELMDEFTENK